MKTKIDFDKFESKLAKKLTNFHAVEHWQSNGALCEHKAEEIAAVARKLLETEIKKSK